MMDHISWSVFLLSLAFLVFAASYPQMRELKKLDAQLEAVEKVEDQLLDELACHKIELNSLQSDVEFLEIHARDRLSVYNSGEKVLKFSK